MRQINLGTAASGWRRELEAVDGQRGRLEQQEEGLLAEAAAAVADRRLPAEAAAMRLHAAAQPAVRSELRYVDLPTGSPEGAPRRLVSTPPAGSACHVAAGRPRTAWPPLLSRAQKQAAATYGRRVSEHLDTLAEVERQLFFIEPPPEAPAPGTAPGTPPPETPEVPPPPEVPPEAPPAASAP